MGVPTDRTYEVEQRLRAIRVYGEDSCCFFKARDGTLLKLQQCWYCRYAVFEQGNSDVNAQGLCKFKN